MSRTPGPQMSRASYTVGLGMRKTYAEIAAASPEEACCSSDSGSDGPSPDARIIGKPRISLPLSQLSLGRTAPPWNAQAWKRLACDIRDDMERAAVMRVRIPGGCDFRAVPRCFPATDVTVHYAVRFERQFSYGEGGALPCVWPGCAVRWSPEGKLAVWTNRGATTDSLCLRRRGMWNEVVVRVRVPSVDGTGSKRGGIVSLSVNGRTTSSPWTSGVVELKKFAFSVRGDRHSGGGVDLADVWLV